jgi:hypothetical protein
MLCHPDQPLLADLIRQQLSDLRAIPGAWLALRKQPERIDVDGRDLVQTRAAGREQPCAVGRGRGDAHQPQATQLQLHIGRPDRALPHGQRAQAAAKGQDHRAKRRYQQGMASSTLPHSEHAFGAPSVAQWTLRIAPCPGALNAPPTAI